MKIKINSNNAPSKIKEIYSVVCEIFEIDIREKSRVRNYVDARTIYFSLCRELTPYSMTVIASFINRDHTTCVHGLKLFNDLMQTDKVFRETTKIALYKCCRLIGSDYKEHRQYVIENFSQLDNKQQRSITDKIKFYLHENMKNVISPSYA